MALDPALLATWLRGWAQVRGLPPPVSVGDALRVEVGWPDQRRRFVFAHMSPHLAELGEAIDEPHVFLKLCGPAERLRAILPPRWQVEERGGMMALAAFSGVPPKLPPPYRLDVATGATATVVRILTEAGEIAASGRLTGVDGFAILDGIVTDAAHRRRGLGRALMAALGHAGLAQGLSSGLLCATPAGRALYEAIGWTLLSPYSSAVIPGEETTR